MSEHVLLGCYECTAIYSTEAYFKGVVSGHQYCPFCGMPGSVQLGVAPSTIQLHGLYYLTDGVDTVGPYNNKQEAQTNLWAWFGGFPHEREKDEQSWSEENESEEGVFEDRTIGEEV